MSRYSKYVLIAIIVSALIFCAFVLSMLYWRTTTMRLVFDQRLQSSNLLPTTADLQFPRSFDQYIAQYQQAIVKAKRVDTNLSEQQLLLQSPFLWQPDTACRSQTPRTGVLLVHGLSDSPYYTRPLGRFFQQRCFVVLSIVLPGHTTQPGDLLDKSYLDWRDAVEYGVEQLTALVDEYHVVGFSLGAPLILGSQRILNHAKAVWLFSPALKIDSRAKWLTWVPYFDWIHKKAAWQEILPDEDPFKYESFPLRSIAEVVRAINLSQTVLAKQAQLPPLFIAASAEDKTIDITGTYKLMHQWRNKKQLVLLTAPRLASHSSFGDVKMLSLGATAAGDKPILSFSHTALMIPPEDDVYGEQGWYHDCRYYFVKDAAAYRRCKMGKADFLAENLQEFTQLGTVERLRYNPLWHPMLHEMDVFLDNL